MTVAIIAVSTYIAVGIAIGAIAAFLVLTALSRDPLKYSVPVALFVFVAVVILWLPMIVCGWIYHRGK